MKVGVDFIFFFDAVMPRHCCVPECSSNSRKNSDDGQTVGFHSFPSDPDLLKRWIVNIRRDVSEHFSLNAYTKVCSLHFQKESFYLIDIKTMKTHMT